MRLDSVPRSIHANADTNANPRAATTRPGPTTSIPASASASAGRGRGRLLLHLLGRDGLVDVFFDPGDPLLELGDALAERAHHAGEAVAEDQERDERDDHQ